MFNVNKKNVTCFQTIGCHVELEREMKIAAREAARQEAKQLMAETGEKYEELLVSVRHHYRAQIEEYKTVCCKCVP